MNYPKISKIELDEFEGVTTLMFSTVDGGCWMRTLPAGTDVAAMVAYYDQIGFVCAECDDAGCESTGI